jgi:hypothetical protein
VGSNDLGGTRAMVVEISGNGVDDKILHSLQRHWRTEMQTFQFDNCSDDASSCTVGFNVEIRTLESSWQKTEVTLVMDAVNKPQQRVASRPPNLSPGTSKKRRICYSTSFCTDSFTNLL